MIFCRLNMEKVRDFIEFISRSTFLQDVAFGTKQLNLSSGERTPIPAVVRTMSASKIVYLYLEECRDLGVEPLKERTCFRLLDVCSVSKQKSLQGLENTSTAGEKAFETIASIVEDLDRYGGGAIMVPRHTSIFKRWEELSQKRIQESSRTG